MKKIVLMVLCSFMSTAFAGGSVHVEDRALLDGGHELLLTGSPEVIMESERGIVYSGQTHILTFDDQSQRRHHKDGVRYITNDGMILIKLYFSITKKEQQRRFDEIKRNPLKRWKMSPVDEKAQELWEVYTDYKQKMFSHTHSEKSPWTILEADKKTIARVQAIEHVLATVPYVSEGVELEEVK